MDSGSGMTAVCLGPHRAHVQEVAQPPKGSLWVALTCTMERGGSALREGAVSS